MKELKCQSCGGTLTVDVNDHSQAVGECNHCGARFLLDDKRKQHLILEHRFPDAPGKDTSVSISPSMLTRRSVLIGSAALAAAGGAIPLFLSKPAATHKVAATPHTPEQLAFNVGGKGVAAGKFRESPRELAIDARGRCAIKDRNGNFYIFDADGHYLAHYPPPFEYAELVTALPGGDLIVGGRTFGRLDIMTGKILDTFVPVKLEHRSWLDNLGANMADGGFARYFQDSGSREGDSSLPGSDTLIIFSADGIEQRRLTNLIEQAIAPDPMIRKAPGASGFAMDSAGNIYICMTRKEDTDTRGGIYEFNANGVFQRKISIEQAYTGHIAATADGIIYYSDPWMSDVQRVVNGTIERVSLSDIGRNSRDGLGMPGAIALYTNGDLGMLTHNDRFLRIKWPL